MTGPRDDIPGPDPQADAPDEAGGLAMPSFDDPGPSAPPGRRWARRAGASDVALLLPFAAAGVWLMGYDGAAMAVALVLPAILLMGGAGWSGKPPGHSVAFRADRPLTRPQAEAVATDILSEARVRGSGTIALMLRVGGTGLARPDWGRSGSERVMQAMARRLRGAMRDGDAVFRTGDDVICVVLQPISRADLDVAMMISDRLQAVAAQPLSLEGRSVRVVTHVGLCTDVMAPERTGAAFLAAADCALRIAARQEEGAVRAFTPEMQASVEIDHTLALEVGSALEKGEIRPWFQAQVDARTGALSGFEALARWYHPQLGVLAPGRFLDAVDAAGRNAELGERMLRASLEAMDGWDKAGLDVPHVGINFSMDELRDPRLAERVAWEVDRTGIAPHRVAVEILETVTLADAEQVIIRNVRALKEAGFKLDLDDFGTGAAAISHIARFGVHRIKIDRSFIDGVEDDPETRRMIGAILKLAAELGIESLAEGVETQAQADALAAMGCGHLQGYGIAKPMPFDETVRWARERARMDPRPGKPDLAQLHPRGSA